MFFFSWGFVWKSRSDDRLQTRWQTRPDDRLSSSSSSYSSFSDLLRVPLTIVRSIAAIPIPTPNPFSKAPLHPLKGGNYRHFSLLEVSFWYQILPNLKKPQPWSEICTNLLYFFYPLHLSKGETIAVFFVTWGIFRMPNSAKSKETPTMVRNMYEFTMLLLPLTSFKGGNYRHVFRYLRCLSDVKFHQT